MIVQSDKKLLIGKFLSIEWLWSSYALMLPVSVSRNEAYEVMSRTNIVLVFCQFFSCKNSANDVDTLDCGL